MLPFPTNIQILQDISGVWNESVFTQVSVLTWSATPISVVISKLFPMRTRIMKELNNSLKASFNENSEEKRPTLLIQRLVSITNTRVTNGFNEYTYSKYQPTFWGDVFFSSFPCNDVVRDSVFDMKTRYGLDGSRIESRGSAIFSFPSRQALGPTNPPVQWVPALVPWVKRPVHGTDHAPSSSTEVKERVELYLYSPLALPCLLLGEIYPFVFFLWRCISQDDNFPHIKYRTSSSCSACKGTNNWTSQVSMLLFFNKLQLVKL